MYGSLVITYRLQINFYDISGPWFFHPSSLYHDFYMHNYARLLVIRPTAFNRAGMVSQGLGGRYRDWGGGTKIQNTVGTGRAGRIESVLSISDGA